MLSFSSPNPHLLSLKKQKPKKRIYGAKQEIMQSYAQFKGEVTIKEHLPHCSIMEDEDNYCNCNGYTETFPNTTLLTGLYSIIERMVDPSNTTDGFITFLEVGMSDTTPANTQTDTILPKARKEIRYAYRDTTNAVFKTFFNGSQANTNQATVSIGTSTTQFTLQGGQGALFAVGQSIKVTIGGTPYTTEITNIATDTLTVSPALGAIPSGGNPVEQLLVEMVLYGTSLADATIGSGTAFARTTSFTPRTKASGFGLTAEWRITLT